MEAESRRSAIKVESSTGGLARMKSTVGGGLWAERLWVSMGFVEVFQSWTWRAMSAEWGGVQTRNFDAVRMVEGRRASISVTACCRPVGARTRGPSMGYRERESKRVFSGPGRYE